MPVLQGAACLTSTECPALVFPTSPTKCNRSFRNGGVNDLYFIPCSELLTESNLTDITWWQGLLTGNKLGNVGVGLGSIARKNITTEKVGSEQEPEPTGITWALKYIIKNFDKTTADTTKIQMDALINKFNRFLLVARMSDGDETVLPIGRFTTSDFNWTVPEDSNQIQNIELELSWKELGLPKQYNIAGLATVLPKAA